MNERLSITVIDRLKDRVHAFVADARQYPQGWKVLERDDLYDKTLRWLAQELSQDTLELTGADQPDVTPVETIFRRGGQLRLGCDSELRDLSIVGLPYAIEKSRRNAVHDADFKSLPSPTEEQPPLERYHDPELMESAGGTPVDLGWQVLPGALVTCRATGPLRYTHSIDGLGSGNFTCTTLGDFYLIADGKLDQPLKLNTMRIDDDFISLFQQIIPVTRDKKPTLLWSAEETVVAPERPVRRVQVENIAGYMG
jgi:hypothetical protein